MCTRRTAAAGRVPRHTPTTLEWVGRRAMALVAGALVAGLVAACAPSPDAQAAKAKELGTQLGFAVMVPAGVPIRSEFEGPDVTLEQQGADQWVQIPYTGYDVAEWSSPTTRTSAQLEHYAFLGGIVPPAGDPNAKLGEDVVKEPMTVEGTSALAVTYSVVMGPQSEGKTVRSSLLVFQLDGLVARISGELNVEEMVALASTFVPIP